MTKLINSTPIRSEDGEAEPVGATMQDLAPLQALDWQRAEFLGMVSHELKVPLTSIKGSVLTALDALPGLDLESEMRQSFRIIDDQADHMRGLISDLLVAGRIEAGTLSVSPEPAELVDLVEQAKQTIQTVGSRNAVQIVLPPDLPSVPGDRGRVVPVLNNLFANASRHSPVSSAIRIAAVRNGTQFAVPVYGEGRGVPSEMLPHLFREHTLVGGIGFLGIAGPASVWPSARALWRRTEGASWPRAARRASSCSTCGLPAARILTGSVHVRWQLPASTLGNAR